MEIMTVQQSKWLHISSDKPIWDFNEIWYEGKESTLKVILKISFWSLSVHCNIYFKWDFIKFLKKSVVQTTMMENMDIIIKLFIWSIFDMQHI